MITRQNQTNLGRVQTQVNSPSRQTLSNFGGPREVTAGKSHTAAVQKDIGLGKRFLRGLKFWHQDTSQKLNAWADDWSKTPSYKALKSTNDTLENGVDTAGSATFRVLKGANDGLESGAKTMGDSVFRVLKRMNDGLEHGAKRLGLPT